MQRPCGRRVPVVCKEQPEFQCGQSVIRERMDQRGNTEAVPVVGAFINEMIKMLQQPTRPCPSDLCSGLLFAAPFHIRAIPGACPAVSSLPPLPSHWAMCVCSGSVVPNSFQPYGLHTACQAPLSMGFPRQEYWSELPCLSPGDLPDPGIQDSRTQDSCISCIGRQILYHQNSIQTALPLRHIPQSRLVPHLHPLKPPGPSPTRISHDYTAT